MQSTVGVLRQHDLNYGTDLLTTLSKYFCNRQHPKNTAAILRIRINTLTRQMARIDELLGAGWRDGPRAASIRLTSQFASWALEQNPQ